MKKIVVVITAIMLVLLAGCSSIDVKTAKTEEFSSKGISITLTKAFKEAEFSGYTVCFDSPEIAVFTLKEEFSAFESFGDISLSEYAQFVLEANKSKSAKEVLESDGLTYLEYEFHNDSENKDYGYFVTMFKGPDAFWLVQFACEKSLYENNKPYFIKWAKTVQFTNE